MPKVEVNRAGLKTVSDRDLRRLLYWTAVEIIERNSNDEAAWIFEDEISEAFLAFDDEDQPRIRIEWG